MIGKIIGYLILTLIAGVQIPAWAWAKLHGRDYQWWGGPQ